MNILFCCHDFKKENLRLMPWRYIYEIAKGLLNKGENVSIFSIEHNKVWNEDIIDGIKVYSVYEKDIFDEKNYENIFETNDIIIWSSSPRTVFYYKNLERLNKPLILLFTGPFYSLGDVMKAQACRVPFNQLSSHYKNAISSPKLLSNMINTNFVKKAVVLSEKNSRFLRYKGASETKITVIPPGYDGNRLYDFNSKTKSDMRKATNLPEDSKILTYMGSLYQIRGVNILIDAFNAVCKKVENILLLILARTNEKTEIARVTKLIKKYSLENRVKVVSGFLEKHKIAEYLYASDAVVLPFLLVPSDMPLGALEAMSLGKPVIATDVDGMPEMVRDRGIIVKPGDRDALATAIISLSQDSSLYSSLKASCVSYMSHYPTWEEVTNRFLSIIH
jgi:phosphatidylinositol alpha-1,6-mannosyltransferase